MQSHLQSLEEERVACLRPQKTMTTFPLSCFLGYGRIKKRGNCPTYKCLLGTNLPSVALALFLPLQPPSYFEQEVLLEGIMIKFNHRMMVCSVFQVSLYIWTKQIVDLILILNVLLFSRSVMSNILWPHGL